MNHKPIAILMLALTLNSGIANARDDHRADRRDDHYHYVRHDEWRKGAIIRHEDWGRGVRIDYRRYHLHHPPHGYEWREVDGNFVLAAIATGAIASVIVASSLH